jgi:hypothetical protein
VAGNLMMRRVCLCSACKGTWTSQKPVSPCHYVHSVCYFNFKYWFSNYLVYQFKPSFIYIYIILRMHLSRGFCAFKKNKFSCLLIFKTWKKTEKNSLIIILNYPSGFTSFSSLFLLH